MKKQIVTVILTAGLLLLNACQTTPTEHPLPTETIAPVTLSPTLRPEPTAVLTPEPTLSPMLKATPSPELTEEPSPIPSPEPTEEPSPTPSPELTEEPSPTPSPEPTEEPSPTPSPEPTETPSPTSSPEPADMEMLLASGWQKTESITETVVVLFPDCFDDSYITRTDRELWVCYKSTADTAVEFWVGYKMKQTLEESLEEILAENGLVVEENLQDRNAAFRLLSGETVHQGILLEEQYSGELLGAAFEEEQTTGVMYILMSYPEERATDYETPNYSYYIIKNREE